MSTSPSSPRIRPAFLILILGALSTITPFAIDFYLPAFQQIAEAMHTSPAKIALSLSSYFVGLSLGQLFYGPLLDRFGRKRPLYIGLLIFIAASMGCMRSESVEALIAFRFLQALGGCVAQVASVAMVRDFFHVKEAAKVFSLLMLILGVSPLLAPTVGGFVATHFGWQFVFVALSVITALILAVVFIYLPEGREPDPSVSLKFKPTVKGFWSILKNPQFSTYSIAGAFSFAGLFAYVAGSPLIFMDGFKVTASEYGAIFAFLSIGMIGGNQLNIFVTKKFSSERIFKTALQIQVAVSTLLWIGALNGGFNLVTTIAIFFAYLSCVGFTYPNAAALAMAPFAKNAGSASALLGFIQMGAGALASTVVGIFDSSAGLPTSSVMAFAVWLGAIVLWVGKKKIVHEVHVTDDETMSLLH
jgi:DHA1 family bicyclomycin/chloramphenicol resistance-like MFS transporter